jgi:hypothetical protein
MGFIMENEPKPCKTLQNHIKMGGVEGAYSTPAESATPRHQYIALKQIGNTTKWGGRESFF